MKLQKIRLETAKLAVKAGFLIKTARVHLDWDVWNDPDLLNTLNPDFKCVFPCPSQELLKKWLREKHNIIVVVNYYLDKTFGGTIFVNNEDGNVISTHGTPLISYSSYEDALENGLESALEYIISNK